MGLSTLLRFDWFAVCTVNCQSFDSLLKEHQDEKYWGGLCLIGGSDGCQRAVSWNGRHAAAERVAGQEQLPQHRGFQQTTRYATAYLHDTHQLSENSQTLK